MRLRRGVRARFARFHVDLLSLFAHIMVQLPLHCHNSCGNSYHARPFYLPDASAQHPHRPTFRAADTLKRKREDLQHEQTKENGAKKNARVPVKVCASR